MLRSTLTVSPLSACGFFAPLDCSQFVVRLTRPHRLSVLILLAACSVLGQTTTISIDTPSSGSTLSGIQVFGGWAVDSASQIAYISLAMDSVVVGMAQYGGARQDACDIYVNYPGCPNVGWSFSVDTSSFRNGWHWLRAVVTTRDGRRTIQDQTFYTNNQSASLVDIDSPAYGSTYSGAQIFGGWTINNFQLVTAVKVFIDGVWIGNAGIGGYRQDACNANGGGVGCPYVGWSFGFDTTTLINGQHALTAVSVTADGKTTSGTTYGFDINNPGTALGIDTPQNLTWYWGINVLGGWAIESASPLESASISIDGIPVGTAPTNARQDVCYVYGNYPGCPNVGWSFGFDTAQLSDGIHQICVVNTFANSAKLMAMRPFVIYNQPSTDVERATTVGPGGCSQASTNLSSAATYRNPGADGLIHITYSLDDQSFAPEVANAIDEWNQYSSISGVELDLVPPGGTADLPIKFDSSGAETGGCASYDPAKVTLFYGTAWESSLTPQAIIAHELGHALGLEDAGSGPPQATIMNNAETPACSLVQGQTTTVQTVDAQSIGTCRTVEHSYMKGLQKAQAVFDAQRNTNSYTTLVYPPYPPVPSGDNQVYQCTYTYSTVNFYVDGVYDSSEQFVDQISCSTYP